MNEQAVLPIVRQSLHDELVGRIRDMIIEGQLEADSRIHEGRLGQALGVSRTPLREALKFIASEGLIDLVPGRGGIVHRLKPRDVRNMLEVLIALESHAGRLACRNAKPEQLAGVRKTHDLMMRFFLEKKRLEYYKLNQAIHTAIVTLSGNDFLASTHESIQARLKRIRFIGNETPGNWNGAAQEHIEMMDALELRDEDRIVEVITRHLEKTWIRVQGVI